MMNDALKTLMKQFPSVQGVPRSKCDVKRHLAFFSVPTISRAATIMLTYKTQLIAHDEYKKNAVKCRGEAKSAD